jgi:hypothetical protein
MAYPFISNYYGSSITGFLVSDFLILRIHVRYLICYFLSIYYFSSIIFPPRAIVFLEPLFFLYSRGIKRHAAYRDSKESYSGIITESILKLESGLAAPVIIRPTLISITLNRSITDYNA